MEHISGIIAKIMKDLEQKKKVERAKKRGDSVIVNWKVRGVSKDQALKSCLGQ